MASPHSGLSEASRAAPFALIADMNWLAHLFVSADTPHAWIGNLIGDFARGLDPNSLHPAVRTGFQQHRAVDRFTDAHPMHRASRARFFEPYRHFSGVLVDLYYDHFLANAWEQYRAEPLEAFVDRVHRVLSEHEDLLSPELRAAAPRLEYHGWLRSYQDEAGLARVLAGIERRSKREIDLRSSLQVLDRERAELEAEFHTFFPELIRYCRAWIVSSGTGTSAADTSTTVQD